MGSTYLDRLYFTLQEYDPKQHASFKYPLDAKFSSPADTTLSCLMAADRYVQFLKNEHYTLKNPNLDPSWEFPSTLHWQKSKTDLIELIYALMASNAIRGDLKNTITVLEKVFNIDLGNFYRTFSDIKYKKNPSAFLDQLKFSLLEKIETDS